MKTGRIGILDSGVGGLSLLKTLNESFNNQHFIYFGDNDNNPYGIKTKSELLSITYHNIASLINAGANSVVFGCNTLSLTVLSQMQNCFDIKIFGIFPPVESCLLKSEKNLLLCTPLTASFYKGQKNLTVLGLKNLASQIDKNIFDLSKVDIKNQICADFSGCDNLILGCTHYFFVKNLICNHLKPLNVIDGVNNTVNMLSKKLKIPKKLDNYCQNQVSFIGNNASFNYKVWSFIKQKNCKI